MKLKLKNLVWMYIIVLSIGTIVSLYIPKQELAATQAVTIPDEAIRLRILANSDLESDQHVKRLVRDAVNKQITEWVQDLTSKEEARNVIKSHLPELKEIAEKVVAEQNVDQAVNIEFGKVKFPTKLYGEFLYPAGKYEAVLITLGKGQGANWWCVLYPPLCFLDFSNGNAVSSQGFEEKASAASVETTDETTQEEQTQVVEKQEPVTETAKVEKQEQVVNNNQEVSTKSVQQEVEKQPSTYERHKQQELSQEVNVVSKQKQVEEETKTKEKAEPVYVEENKEDEVEMRFFVVDLFKGLFK